MDTKKQQQQQKKPLQQPNQKPSQPKQDQITPNKGYPQKKPNSNW